MKTNRAIRLLRGGILAILLAVGWHNVSLAEDISSILPQHFSVDTEIQVQGAYLTVNKQNPETYSLQVKWPVQYLPQWANVLEFFGKTKPADTIYNPFDEHDPDILVFTQKNPDQISGEDVYISQKRKIIRITRKAHDSYFTGGKDFLAFLTGEMDKRQKEYMTPTEISITRPGLVVVYRSTVSAFNNPYWYVTDPDDISLYLAFMNNLKRLPDYMFEVDVDNRIPSAQAFDSLETFMIYTNYPGAPYQLISLNKFGYSRATSITLDVRGYDDTNNFFKSFMVQANDAIRQEHQNQEIRERRKRVKEF